MGSHLLDVQEGAEMTSFQRGASKPHRLFALLAAALIAFAGVTGAIAQAPPATNATEPAPSNTVVPDPAPANSTATNTTVPAPNAGVPESAQQIDPAVYGEMFKILFAVFTIAVVLESALAVIFNWRLFLVYFDSRGTKTIVSVLAGVLVATSLHLDIIDRLYKAMYPGGSGLGPFGYFLTGLVLAGGSAGVNNILKTLGFRSLQTAEAKQPKPRTKEAWLAVRLKRIRSEKTPVQVFLTRDNDGERLIGTIMGTRAPSIFARLRTNPMRYPNVAGFAVPADSLVTVQLRDPTLPAGEDVSEPWGPYRIGEGAIIDFELTL